MAVIICELCQVYIILYEYKYKYKWFIQLTTEFVSTDMLNQ